MLKNVFPAPLYRPRASYAALSAEAIASVAFSLTSIHNHTSTDVLIYMQNLS
jgi:hypothetical protein